MTVNVLLLVGQKRSFDIVANFRYNIEKNNHTVSLGYSYSNSRVTHMHNHFTALLDFVWDYPDEPAPER